LAAQEPSGARCERCYNFRPLRDFAQFFAMTRFSTSVLAAAAVCSLSVAHAQEGSFVSAGVQLHYTSRGTGAPIVLLSGGPGFDVDYVLPIAQFLPPGYRSIAFEQRGTGRSRPKPFDLAPLTLKTVVEDLEALRVHLQQERLTLLGHSWGGMLGMAYAAAHPDRVDRLILVESGGPTLEFARWFGDNIEARLRPEDRERRDYWRAATTNGVDAGKAAAESLRAILPGYFFDRKAGLAFASAFKPDQYRPDLNGRLFADLTTHYDSREGLKNLKRPVLIIQAHQDPIGDKTAEDIRALITGSKLVYIDRSGHFPWIEQPDAFRKAIAEFLPTPPQ
jgi:proline iminopeptidase